MAPNPLSFITACLPCFPTAVVKKSKPAGSHRAEYYNAALRANLGMPERPPRLPVSAESQRQKEQQQQRAETGNNSTGDHSESPSLAPARRSAPQGRGRFPTTASAAAGASSKKNANPKWSSTPMETAQLEEFFDRLATLEHLPYAICGRGALVDHGLSARKAKQVSILVPAYCKDVVASWAKSSGWVVQRHETAGANGNANGVFVGVPLASDGSLRQLRVKYLDDDSFEQLERVRSRLSRGAAWVLSLTSQLDHLAAAWLDFYRQSKATTTTTTPAAGKKSKVNHDKSLREIARDILWTLNAMAAAPSFPPPKDSKGKGKAKAVTNTSSSSSRPDLLRLLPTLQSEDFFVPFTDRCEEARTEMARAGIDVSAVLVGIRERRALREHNAMLARYGAAPLPRARAGGNDDDELPFNRIRDLNHSKSVYTLATNISVSELGPRSPRSPASTAAAAAPLTPPVPAVARQQQQPPTTAAVARLRREHERGWESDERQGEEERRSRPRSAHVSGVRPSLLATASASASAPDLLRKKSSERSGLRRSESTRAPPRRSAIPPAAPGRKSSDWI
ncbi:hypothetical protein SLS62_001015 [Diatrype stigma]|uniref:Uncharacterized protein n=1 Tax=Diatrype stigma TaxID=117547 RepID=A0AAN9UWU8_9PEZI